MFAIFINLYNKYLPNIIKNEFYGDRWQKKDKSVNQEIMQETDCSRLVIKSNGPASVQFLKLKCNNFQEAFDYINGLPDKRNQQRHFHLAVLV